MKLAEFAAWVIHESALQGIDLDGAEVQGKAVEFGLLLETRYDPEQHGGGNCEAARGDPWFVFTPELKAALRSGI